MWSARSKRLGAKSPGVIILEHELTNDTVQAYKDTYPPMQSNNWQTESIARIDGSNKPYQNADGPGRWALVAADSGYAVVTKTGGPQTTTLRKKLPSDPLDCFYNMNLSTHFRDFGKQVPVVPFNIQIDFNKSPRSVGDDECGLGTGECCWYLCECLNAGFGKDKSMVEAKEGSSWIYKNKDLALACASNGWVGATYGANFPVATVPFSLPLRKANDSTLELNMEIPTERNSAHKYSGDSIPPGPTPIAEQIKPQVPELLPFSPTNMDSILEEKELHLMRLHASLPQEVKGGPSSSQALIQPQDKESMSKPPQKKPRLYHPSFVERSELVPTSSLEGPARHRRSHRAYVLIPSKKPFKKAHDNSFSLASGLLPPGSSPNAQSGPFTPSHSLGLSHPSNVQALMLRSRPEKERMDPKPLDDEDIDQNDFSGRPHSWSLSSPNSLPRISPILDQDNNHYDDVDVLSTLPHPISPLPSSSSSHQLDIQTQKLRIRPNRLELMDFKSLGDESTHDDADDADEDERNPSFSKKSSTNDFDYSLEDTLDSYQDLHFPQTRKELRALLPDLQASSQASQVDTGPLDKFINDHQCGSHNTICTILSFFSMQYQPVLGAIVCLVCMGGCIIPLAHWSRHVLKRHNFSCPKAKRHALREMVQHIGQSYGIDLDQTASDLHLPAQLNEPISCRDNLTSNRSQSILFRYHCPFVDAQGQRCSFWAAINTSKGCDEAELKKHLKKLHPKLKATTYQGQWTQGLAVIRDTKSIHKHIFILPDDFKLQDASSKRATGVKSRDAAPTATWMTEIRFDTILDNLGPKASIQRLQWLVTLPSLYLATSSNNKVVRWMERGLLLLHKETHLYLKGASQFRTNQNQLVSTELYQAALSNMTNLKNSTLYGYREALSRTTSMMLRLLYLHEIKSREGLGNLELIGSEEQASTAASLYALFQDYHGHPPILELRPLMHQFYQALLQTKDLEESFIACPTDMMLFLCSLSKGTSRFVSARRLRDLCYRLGYCFRAITIHTIRLTLEGHNSYVEYKPSLDTLATSCLSEENDSDDDYEEGSDDSGNSDIEEGNRSEAEEKSPVAAKVKRAAFELGFMRIAKPTLDDSSSVEASTRKALSLIQDHVIWLVDNTNRGFTTPFSRMNRVLSFLHRGVSLEDKPAHITVRQDGDILEVSNGGLPPIHVDLQLWRRTAKLSIIGFKDAVNRLLPAGSSADDFPIDRIVDTHALHAASKQTQNAIWMDPIRDTILANLLAIGEDKHKLIFGGNIDRRAVDKWLALDQEVLSAGAAASALNWGICPSACRFKMFCFDGGLKHPKDVSVAANGLLLLRTHSMVRDNEEMIVPSLVAFPPDMSRHLAFYLFILRPIICVLLEQIGKEVPLYSSRIWAHTTRHPRAAHQWLWTGPEVTKALQYHTMEPLGIALTPSTIQGIAHGLLKHHFPPLFAKNYLSLVDIQAQHIRLTSLANYGRLLNIPAFEHMNADSLLCFLAICQIWQAALAVGPLNEVWRHLIHDSDIFPTTNYRSLGFQVARNAIGLYYGVHGGVRNVQTLVHTLLTDLPFLAGSMLQSDRTFGDKVLSEVLRAILFGSDQAGISLTPPIGGILIDDAAEAVTLIVRALNEWSSKKHVDLSILDSKSLLHYEEVKIKAKARLTAIRDGDQRAWISFSAHIFSTSPIPVTYTATAKMRSLTFNPPLPHS
ncbi:hypothetical protein EW146_g1613 [Bondarzewia mesenterica]|uniref:Uncharacterized protein n=1 Tax=Bondarzewia mesenterica TaxID=1095465 RepID=A0A4S4M3D4_9AGAM|nr:hypothetical protein EW146_g1613 [Bondarzewia mesenterica]